MFSINVTLIFHIFNFGLIYMTFRYFLSSKIAKAIEDRRRAVNKEIEDAHSARSQAEELREQVMEELSLAKIESKSIIERAMRESAEMKKEILSEARDLKKKMLKDGERELAALKEKLSASLKRESLSFALKISERLIEKSVDESVIKRAADELREVLN